VHRCLEMAASFSNILAFSSYFALFPPYGFSSQVAYRHITISSPPTGHACDVYDRLCVRHLPVVLASTLQLPISVVYNFNSSWVGAHAAALQLLPP
jgi:hypothetical protein